jgi:hypothetical protein
VARPAVHRPGLPGLIADTGQCCQAAGVNEVQSSQIDDDLALIRHGRPESRHDAHGVCDIKLSRQPHDSVAAAFAGTQIHAKHKDASLL